MSSSLSKRMKKAKEAMCTHGPFSLPATKLFPFLLKEADEAESNVVVEAQQDGARVKTRVRVREGIIVLIYFRFDLKFQKI